MHPADHSLNDFPSDEPVIAALRAGVELRNVEFKESQPFDELRWKIARTAMAMANLRDGGYIIVGGHQRNGPIELDGVTAQHESTYDADTIIEAINRHARPPVLATVRVVSYDGRRFVAIEIRPFERSPIVCRRGTPQGVRERDAMNVGDIFVRSRDRIATTRLVDDELMAELVEIAAERRAREIIATAQRVGLQMPPSNAAAFLRERDGFEPSLHTPEPLDLNSLPRLTMALAPQEYDTARFTLNECRDLMEGAQVHSRGWVFPYYERDRVASGPGGAYMAGSYNNVGYVTHADEWRLYRSGQFLFRGMLWEALDQEVQDRARANASRWWGPRRNVDDVRGFVEFRMLIALVGEAYVFASRLAATQRFGPALDIEVGLRGVERYGLASNQFGARLHNLYIAAADSVFDRTTIPVDILVAEAFEAAANATNNLFQQFGWFDASRAAIRQHQQELIGRL